MNKLKTLLVDRTHFKEVLVAHKGLQDLKDFLSSLNKDKVLVTFLKSLNECWEEKGDQSVEMYKQKVKTF